MVGIRHNNCRCEREGGRERRGRKERKKRERKAHRLTQSAGCVGGLILGILGDTVFRRNFKILLIGLFVASTALFSVFSLSLPSIFGKHAIIPIHGEWFIILSVTLGNYSNNDSDSTVVPTSLTRTHIHAYTLHTPHTDLLLCKGGLFLGSTIPIFMECGAEMTYPISGV